VDDDEFTLQQTDSSLFTAYTSGGTIRKVSSVITIPLTVCADTTYPLFGASCIHSSLTDGKTYQFLATIRIWSSSEGGNHEHSALTILEVKR
jgi:hypothetical protein